MSYLILHLNSPDAPTITMEQVKDEVNKILRRELVDETSIFWDDENDLVFVLPRHKPFKDYWVSLLSQQLSAFNWGITRKI